MLGIVANRITGFKFLLKNQNREEDDDFISLKVELLEEGELISTERLDEISKEEFARLQSQLLDAVAVNLDVGDNWTLSKECSKRSRVLGVVNMFKIDILEENEDGTKKILVEFIKNGYYAAESVFNNVTDKKIREIRKMIAENMAYNFKCQKQCNAVTYLDLIVVIEQKISNE